MDVLSSLGAHSKRWMSFLRWELTLLMYDPTFAVVPGPGMAVLSASVNKTNRDLSSDEATNH